MRLLIIGANGQLGWELSRSLSAVGEVVVLDRRHVDLERRPNDGAEIVLRYCPDVVVNAAAYTAVDKAENEPALAEMVNGHAVGILAGATREVGGLFVHYSSDYVFDGLKTTPYTEDDPTGPLSSYGRSKLEGEKAVRAIGGDWLIFRTTWVFGSRGQNFLKTMLRLGAERESLRVVADQRGAPTNARLLAETTAHAIRQALKERARADFESGIFHLSASGETTWHAFAEKIFNEARNLIPGVPLKIRELVPVKSADYPVAARRPLNSILSNAKFDERFGLYRPDWTVGLRLALEEIAQYTIIPVADRV